MTNIFRVCLFFSLILIPCLVQSSLPNICSKGPTYWCENLRSAADCNAVQHCIQTVWEKQSIDTQINEYSARFINLFTKLKDIRTKINEDYLMAKVESECKDLPYNDAIIICQLNILNMGTHLKELLDSEASPESMCRAISMCDNDELEFAIFVNKMKDEKLRTEKSYLVGTNKCTWGPSYWCSNFSTVHTCGGTKHCIERVWSNMNLPEDKDDICKICTDMVTQAKQVLESNETQENLKLVFEGSCDLIPIKIISKECKELADDYIPELVETLSSQMNPQVVCSVAGLCNSERVDKLLEEYNNKLQAQKECNECFKYVKIFEKRMEAKDSTDFRQGLLQVCRKMSSYSDSCSMLVLEHYEQIVKTVKDNLVPQTVCLVTKECQSLFHTHDGFKLPKFDNPEVKANDDVPCEFCEKLVMQLRDMLVANTTALEFHKIIKGICDQTGKFKDECNRLANDYYNVLYHFLVEEMKPHEICAIIGVCGAQENVPVALLVIEDRFSSLITGKDEANSYISEVSGTPNNDKKTEEQMQLAQLPIERMTINLPQSRAYCAFCEYFLHYVQVGLSDAKTEQEILDSASKACVKFPVRMQDECRQFVQQYGNIFIVLLVQQIDPASVCPLLHACPAQQEFDTDVAKPSCPLCLLAVEQVIDMMKNNRSEEKIRQALQKLCTHFQPSMRAECTEFVDKYGEQLIEKLLSNHGATEVCTYLKLCTDEEPEEASIVKTIDKYHEKPQLRGDRNNFRRRPMLPPKMLENAWEGDIETNEIPDNTRNGQEVDMKDEAECSICKLVFQYVYQAAKDRTNKEEIKDLGHEVCKHLNKKMKMKCDDFVDKYADLILSILADELRPEEACQQLKLCPVNIQQFRGEVLQCAVCEAAASTMEELIKSRVVELSAEQLATETCDLLPARYVHRCDELMRIYGESLSRVIEQNGARIACVDIGQCTLRPATLRLAGGL